MARHIPTEPRETPFSIFLWGGEETFNRRKSILKEFTTKPVFDKKLVTLPSLPRMDAWTGAAYQSRELINLKLKHGWSNRQFMDAITMTDNMLPVQPQFRSMIPASHVAEVRNCGINITSLHVKLGASNVRRAEGYLDPACGAL